MSGEMGNVRARSGAIGGQTDVIGKVYRERKESGKSNSILASIASIFTRLKKEQPGNDRGLLDLSRIDERDKVISDLASAFSKARKEDGDLTVKQFKKMVEYQFNRGTCRFSRDPDTARTAVQRFKDDLETALSGKFNEMNGVINVAVQPNSPKDDRRPSVERVVSEMVKREQQNWDRLHGNYLEWTLGGNGEKEMVSPEQQIRDEELDAVVGEMIREEEKVSFPWENRKVGYGPVGPDLDTTIDIEGESEEDDDDDDIMALGEGAQAPVEVDDDSDEGEETILGEVPEQKLNDPAATLVERE